MYSQKIGLVLGLIAATFVFVACSSPKTTEPQLIVTGSGNSIVGVSDAMRGIGTEPFRGFTVDGNTLERRVITEEKGQQGIQTTTFVGIIQESSGSTLSYTDTNDKITVTASSEECQSTTSETAYPYTVAISYDGDEFLGCGELID